MSDAPEDDLRFPLDAGPGPASPVSAERAAAMVQAAMEAHERAEPARLAPPARRSGARRWAMLAIAAAFLLVLGTALAATLLAGRRRPAPVPSSPVTWSPPTPVVSAVPAPPPEVVTSAAVAEPSAASSVAVVPREPPADLLRLANQQRTEHKWTDAEKTYRRVTRRAPGGAEAYAATVAAASIRLEHLHDAAGALELYRSALAQRPGGSLSEEASWGVASSERALGDTRAERAALRAFVAAHPDAVMRPSAESRLRELGEDSATSP